VRGALPLRRGAAHRPRTVAGPPGRGILPLGRRDPPRGRGVRAGRARESRALDRHRGDPRGRAAAPWRRIRPRSARRIRRDRGDPDPDVRAAHRRGARPTVSDPTAPAPEEVIARPDFEQVVADEKNREIIEEFENEAKTRTLY